MKFPWKSSSGTSTDNGRQAPADVPDPATVARRLEELEAAGREAAARKLAALGGEGEGRAEELRSQGVIETAPVGLIIANDVGEVVAANPSALGLFGVEQPEDVIGKALDRCVAAEDSDAVASFVLRVCGGASGSLECQLVGSDGLRRVVEIRAVPLRRNDTTVFVGAVWDVSEPKGSAVALQDAQARCERLEEQRSASEQALSETNKALEDLRREHQGLAESLQDAQHQLQTAPSEAHARQEEMAATGAAQLVMERTTQQGALESMERQYHVSVEAWTAEGQQIERVLSDLCAEKMGRQYHVSLEAWTAERQQIERAITDLRARYDEMLRRSRDESEHFAATVCELERRCAQLTDNQHAVREVLEGAVRTEREYYAVLTDVQTQWQTKLAQAPGTVGDASAHTEDALDSSQSRQPLTESPSQSTDDRPLSSDDSPTAGSEPDENGQTERGTTNAGSLVASVEPVETGDADAGRWVYRSRGRRSRRGKRTWAVG